MTDKKISQLSNATTPLAGTEVLPIVQGASTVKVSVANLTAGRTVDATTVNATTVDATNVEVTNIKAQDGTAALAIANSTGAITVSSATALNGAVVVNEPGDDVDFRVESDTNTHALFVDAGNSRVGVNNSAPAVAFDVVGDQRVIGSDAAINKTQLGPYSTSGGGVVQVAKRLEIAAGTVGATIFTISSVNTNRVAQVWEVLINSQATGSAASRAQRSQKIAFTVTTANGNVPVVDIISGYGWADTLSSNPTGGDRNPTALNTAVTVDGSNNVIVTIDANATIASGSLTVTVFATGTGRQVSLTTVS